MWMIAIRAAALIGLGMGAGSMMSTPSAPQVPQTVYQEATSSISPFLIVAIALLICAAGYFVHSVRKNR